MDILNLLKKLYKNRTINKQQYNTYKGQVISGDGIGCVKGLKRKHLISDAKADALILSLAPKG